MAERSIEEIKADYKDCQRCEDKSCLGMVSNCPKDGSIVTREAELMRAVLRIMNLDRLEEICTAERDGRCVVLEKPALNENSPKPKCFYNDNNSKWCLGLAQGDDDYPINNCQKCFYCEFNAQEREETEASTKR